MSDRCPHCRDGYVEATMHGEGFSGPMPCPDCGGEAPNYTAWDPGERSKEGFVLNRDRESGRGSDVHDVDRLIAELKINHYGRNNAIGGAKLAEVLGLKNDRALRKLVAKAREPKIIDGEETDGAPIISRPGKNGYWWSDGSKEDEHGVNWQFSMSYKYLANAKNINRGMHPKPKPTVQGRLF